MRHRHPVIFLTTAVLLAAGCWGEPDPTDHETDHPRIAVVSHGEKIEVGQHLGEGYTAFEFTADW